MKVETYTCDLCGRPCKRSSWIGRSFLVSKQKERYETKFYPVEFDKMDLCEDCYRKIEAIIEACKLH